MAKEYQRTSGGTLQWRDPSAGVSGWNNIERNEEPSSQKAPTAKPVTVPAPAMPNPAASMSSAPPPPSAPLAGLTALDPGGSDTLTMPPPISAGAGSTASEQEAAPMLGVATQALGQLRNLGRRTYPSMANPLAGLGRVY